MFAGALVQVAIGIGFSVIAGPLLVVGLGAKTAAPVLLLMNFVVSGIGILGLRNIAGGAAVGQSMVGALIGIALGAITFPSLSETFVSLAMAVMRLGGAAYAGAAPWWAGWQAVAGAGMAVHT